MSSNSFLSQGIRTSPAFRELPGSGRTAEARRTRQQLCRHGVGDLFSAVHSGQLDWEGRSSRSLALSLEERPGCPGSPRRAPRQGRRRHCPLHRHLRPGAPSATRGPRAGSERGTGAGVAPAAVTDGGSSPPSPPPPLREESGAFGVGGGLRSPQRSVK